MSATDLRLLREQLPAIEERWRCSARWARRLREAGRSAAIQREAANVEATANAYAAFLRAASYAVACCEGVDRVLRDWDGLFPDWRTW